MVDAAPVSLRASEAGRLLVASLRDARTPLTIADAATASGLALRDAESGLHWLTNEYRGHLRVTSDGELLFLFPDGFTKPWQQREALMRAWRAFALVASGVARFVVRGWVTVVLLSYAAVFVAWLFAQAASRDNDRLGGGIAEGFFRLVADALFWTFHPFSPFAFAYDDAFPRRVHERDTTPFYEKVNRFFFGPTSPPDDPRDLERAVLAEARANRGRIGVGDVMRVTGLARDVADPMMARLMLDYEGEVDVGEGGGIVYRFPALRKTANAASKPLSSGGWARRRSLPALTGNGAGTNALIALINAFNLLLSCVALGAGLTLERLLALFRHTPPDRMPPPALALLLGVIPLVFSLALFALPLGRAALRPLRARRLAIENARLSLIREVVTATREHVALDDQTLRAIWSRERGMQPADGELAREVAKLGGDVAIGELGEVRYRFADLEAEAIALEAERAVAGDAEARVGQVIFASDQ